MDNFIHSTNNKYDRSMPRLEIKNLFDQVLAKCYPELKRNSIFEALEGDACKSYGDYGFFGVVEICQKLRKTNPSLFYEEGPIDIAKKIMGEFESRKHKMIKRLQLHDAGILTFRLTGRWMAERINKVLNDGMDTWAPTGFGVKRGVFVFPTNTIENEENENGDMIRATYIKDALVNMYLYSGVNVGSGFCDDSALKVAREQFTEKQGVIVSKNSLCVVKGPSNDVYTDLATLWHGANTQKADLMVYMTPHQLRGYIQQCHIAATKEGLLPVNWKGILTCCGFRTFSGEQQKLFDLYGRYKEQATSLQRLGLAAGYTDQGCFECAFKFTCLKRQRLAECTFKFEDMLYDKEGNSFASLLETRALLRSLVKDYPARNLFALAGIECDIGLHLVKFTEVIERACQAFVPDIVCEYLCNLSKLFTRYYHKVQPGVNMLGLCKATEMVMNKCFHLLGIAPSSDNYWGNTFVTLKRKKAWETGLYISPISEVDARNNCLNSRFELFSMNVSVAHSNFDEGYIFGTIYVLDKFRSRPDGWELFDKEDDCHVSYFKREWHSPVDINNGSLIQFENPSSLHSIPFSSPIEVSALVKATSKEKDQTYVICNCKGTPKVSEFWAGDSNIQCGTFKIDGKDGRINLHYILLKDALDTTMELMFNHVKTVRVWGTIVAYYGDDIVGDGGFLGQYKALIFEADPSKSIRHKKPHPLPLHKSTLAVPANGSLKIEAHLVDVDSNKVIVNHMKEFRESESPSIWKIPFGKGSFEFRVNWLHRVQGGSNQVKVHYLFYYNKLVSRFDELDENLQKAFHKYLEIRGIKPSATNFLNKEYTNWLKNLKKFVEA